MLRLRQADKGNALNLWGWALGLLQGAQSGTETRKAAIMDALTRYAKAKQDIAEAQAFAALLASGAATDVEIKLAVTGEQRVKMPESLRNALQGVVEKKADNLIGSAITAMQAELAKLADQAVTEYRAIAADVGLILPR